jgi:hypothetical protein
VKSFPIKRSLVWQQNTRARGSVLLRYSSDCRHHCPQSGPRVQAQAGQYCRQSASFPSHLKSEANASSLGCAFPAWCAPTPRKLRAPPPPKRGRETTPGGGGPPGDTASGSGQHYEPQAASLVPQVQAHDTAPRTTGLAKSTAHVVCCVLCFVLVICPSDVR